MAVIEVNRNVTKDVFSPNSILTILGFRASSYKSEALPHWLRSNLVEGLHLTLHDNLSMLRGKKKIRKITRHSRYTKQ